MLCAGAFGPLLATAAGVSGAAALAGVGVLAPVGGNVLTDVLKAGIAKLRSGTADARRHRRHQAPDAPGRGGSRAAMGA
ncbi:hypothetical protein [Nonomuraea sp. JJY05]|uniref:hypothetical protein n=1 Tax=Nonomuraea sp. JJY05 TaxID=3350255 RepID=UPI00373EC892